MGVIKVSKCDCCGKEQRDDAQRHWTASFGNVDLNFKDIPAVQREFSLKLLCPDCAEKLCGAIDNKVKEIRGIKPQEGGDE